MPDIFNSKHQIKETKEVPKTKSKNNSSKRTTVKKKSTLTGNVHRLKGHSHNPMSAFCYYPDNVTFINEDPEEKVVLLLRRHPITNSKWIIVAFIMILIPSFFNLLPFWEVVPIQMRIVSVIIWYLITTAFIFEEFLSWFFHVNIITDERILEVDFINLIYREMTDANIDNIEDVTVELGGALRTFFNYGTIAIQTAGDIPKIDFEDVPHPDRVAKILRELRIEEEQEKLEGRVR